VRAAVEEREDVDLRKFRRERIRATLAERADGIVLDIHGAEGEELSAIVQSLRQLLTSMVH
jgi:hypothetical protein